MENTIFTLRPASLADGPTAAELLCATTGQVADVLFGIPDHARALKAMQSFFEHPRNRFSHTLTQAADLDGQMAGLLLAYPSDQDIALTLPLGGLLLKEYGLAGALGVVGRGISLAGGKEHDRGEYYIAHVATLPQFRGRGAATSLLQHAETRARELGLRKCSLIVDLGNETARLLYARLGYKVVETVDMPKLEKKYATRGYLRMIKRFQT
jgi:ribosomal protein S18 acetylase RimI-like enzyme